MLINEFWEYFFNPKQFEVLDAGYKVLREETEKLIKALPETNVNKVRWAEKLSKEFPKNPKLVSSYKSKLQQLHRRVKAKVDG